MDARNFYGDVQTAKEKYHTDLVELQTKEAAIQLKVNAYIRSHGIEGAGKYKKKVAAVNVGRAAAKVATTGGVAPAPVVLTAELMVVGEKGFGETHAFIFPSYV